MNRKVTVIGGAGNVGATVARSIANRELADVVIIDIAESKAAGVALDIFQACPIEGSDSRVIGGSDYALSEGSDIVVITSGVPRKPGMSRDDLLQVNYKIMQDVTANVVKYSPDAIVVVVANPLDAMAQAVHKLSGFPRERVLGMAGVLDSARMRTFIAMELNVSLENIHAFVLGGHGDTMVPITSFTNVGGVPITQKIEAGRLEEIVQRARDGGAEVVRLLQKGSAYYAPSAAVAEMVDSIVHDQKRILPCAALCQGEYGIDGLFVGVPVKLGAEGLEEIVEYDLTDSEQSDLESSAAAVQELVDALKSL